MADFQKTVKEIDEFPKLRKTLELSAGGKITDDEEVVAFAALQVPEGKKALVDIMISVRRLEDE